VLCCLAAAFMMGQLYLFRKRIAGRLGFGVSASRAVDWHPGQSQSAITSHHGAQRRRIIAWAVPAVAMLLSTVLIAVHLHHQQQPLVDGGTSMCRSSRTEAAAK
jgi:hypothetical protein